MGKVGFSMLYMGYGLLLALSSCCYKNTESVKIRSLDLIIEDIPERLTKNISIEEKRVDMDSALLLLDRHLNNDDIDVVSVFDTVKANDSDIDNFVKIIMNKTTKKNIRILYCPAVSDPVNSKLIDFWRSRKELGLPEHPIGTKPVQEDMYSIPSTSTP